MQFPSSHYTQQAERRGPSIHSSHYPNQPLSHNPNSTVQNPWPNGLEDENERLQKELNQKVSTLRSLSIRIGDELKEQNTFLSSMAGAFDRSEGVLRSTMNRVLGIGRNSSGCSLYCYLLCFASLVFFICWLIIRFR
ncbi:unnamed protein product [Calicophoron daubneyi]|uniref:t-SNARE coiled-coil homology domain-containing protein n=1 Tax=Calicophoron daubneyi TaxID=300641 RepID=A0AAV2T3U8_CALDB